MRREPLKPTQRATPRIKLHKPLIKLIKKDHCVIAQQPSTTNPKCNPKAYKKDIKWLGNPYRHTVLNAV